MNEHPDCLIDYDFNRTTGHQFLRAVMTDKYHRKSVDFMSIKWMEIFVQITNENDAPPMFVPIGKALFEIFIGDCED